MLKMRRLEEIEILAMQGFFAYNGNRIRIQVI